MNISVVVPVYRAQDALPELVRRLEPVLGAAGGAYELILVNDGSPDDSWRVIRELAKGRPWIRGLDLMRNYGQHNALLCGIREARHPVIVTLDDDLQHPPEEMPRLLQRLESGCDVVYGSFKIEQRASWRRASTQIIRFALSFIVGRQTARQVTAFRAFRTQLRDAFSHYASPFVSIDVLLSWGARRVESVEVRHDPRFSGSSSYSFNKLALHAVDIVTGFSSQPLRLASFVGIAFTLFGFLVLAYVIGRYLIVGYSVPGFPFLASIVAIFSGAQLFALGIIGEYLGRVHFRTMARPAFVVRGSTSGGERKEEA
jgi:undecaprenyl-phosphate 4-deoxy-4-formamido-L-arabinose transferase